MGTVEEEMRMIPDGPERFPGSCVRFVFFNDYRLRALYARHREREAILQKEMQGFRESKDWEQFRSRLERLQEVESVLVFMAANLNPDAQSTWRPRRRKKAA